MLCGFLGKPCQFHTSGFFGVCTQHFNVVPLFNAIAQTYRPFISYIRQFWAIEGIAIERKAIVFSAFQINILCIAYIVIALLQFFDI